jgi:hypothetical protein
MSLSQWCRDIVESAHLVDETGKPIKEFANWRTLRSRLEEAQKIRRETNYRTITLPKAPRGPLTMYLSEGVLGSARTQVIADAVGWAGTTSLRVPPAKSRRKRVAELSKLSARSEIKLHK